MSSAPDKIDTTVRPPTIGQVPRALWVLIGAMAVIELFLTGSDRGLVGNPEWRGIAFLYGAFWDPLTNGIAEPVFSLQPYTMYLTHAFLHADLFHLLMNSVILLSIGKLVAEQAGVNAMLLLFVVCAIGGGIGFALLADTTIPAIGASGAVFGFLAVWQYWDGVIRQARGLSLKPVFQTIIGLIILNIVLALWMQGGLAWQAHLGGFVAGLAMGPVMTHYARQHANRLED
ncbi:MAG: rhomboid family intramembrane serine protease [Aquisalinus sp.]|nr:rhomboid family intramembrane serine protease [Aquisalinus sp.]